MVRWLSGDSHRDFLDLSDKELAGAPLPASFCFPLLSPYEYATVGSSLITL